MSNSFGIVGYGHFGQFVHTLLKRYLPNAPVHIYTKNSNRTGISGESLGTVAKADIVFVCVNISAYETVIEELQPLLGPNTILVDVATVKVHTTNILARYKDTIKYVSTHPMFGPESYRKQQSEVTSFRIVVTDYSLLEASLDNFIKLFEAVGFVVVRMSADEHDRLLAETLFVTHYISQTLLAAGIKRTVLDTVSFGSLMNAVESVASDTQLFADVYRYNPYCHGIVDRLHSAETIVFKHLET